MANFFFKKKHGRHSLRGYMLVSMGIFNVILAAPRLMAVAGHEVIFDGWLCDFFWEQQITWKDFIQIDQHKYYTISYIIITQILPVVPHKAVAEVSKIGNL